MASRLGLLLVPVALALVACGGPSEVDVKCAALHGQNASISEELDFAAGESVEETMDRGDRLLEIGERMKSLGCGPASEYE